MQIRPLVPADWEAYRAIRLETLQDSPEAFASSFEEQKDLPPEYWSARLAEGGETVVFGLFSAGRVVAVAAFTREARRKIRHKGTITGVFVSPAFRGRGIARALLTEILRQARSMPGLEQVMLAVVSSNAPARGLYESLGFRVFGTELRALKVGDRYLDEEHMVLFL